MFSIHDLLADSHQNDSTIDLRLHDGIYLTGKVQYFEMDSVVFKAQDKNGEVTSIFYINRSAIIYGKTRG